MARWWHLCCCTSFTQIINWETDVLNEKFSISSVTFLMVLCNDLYISAVGSSLVTINPLSSAYKRHNFLRKPKTPVIPAVFQGFACSNGPKNISYKRNVSAPYSSQISSGFTTLYQRLDIFSTSRPTMYFPFSKINVASENCGCHAFSFSTSISSDAFTRLTSTRNSSV